MATTRQRRVKADPPAQELYAEEDRIYTEDDYAIPASTELIQDEWESAQDVYPSAGWTGENYMPDEAFQPDEAEQPGEAAWAEDFSEPGYEPRFQDDLDFTDDLDPLSEDLLTEEEQAELKRSHWKLLASLADFAGVIVGTAAILLLLTLLFSLLNWLVNDMSQSFILLQKHL